MSERMKSICEAVSEYHEETGKYPTAQQVAEWCRSPLDAAIRAIHIVKHRIEYGQLVSVS